LNYRALSVLALSLVLPPVHAESGTAERRAFLAAEQAWRQGDRQTYEQLRTRLEGYALVPYLDYRELRDTLSRTSPAAVRSYLNAWPESPTARRLRNAWLDRLAGEGRWKEYREFFDPDDSDVTRRCRYLNALIHTGARETAFEAMPEIWLHGSSRPDACDGPINAWRNAGHLTTGLVWDRVELAMAAGSIDLARYLKRFLPAADRPRFDLWIKVDADPATWLPVVARSKDTEATKPLLAHGVKKLARRGDPHQAADIWRASQSRFAFSNAESCVVEERLAIALEDEPDPEAYRFFENIDPCDDATRLQEARVRAALLRQDWPSVARWIDAMPAANRGDERWLYWKARALEATGETRAAKKLYQRAAAERTYYGFLAADRIDAPYRYDHIAIDVDEVTLSRVRDMPGMQRMHELYALDRIIDARREWLVLVPNLERGELLAASRIFDDWGWSDRAIFTSARAGYWDDLEMRFPLHHADRVAQYAGKRNLDPSWVFGVMRQESAFMTDVRSSAGAVGLMQVMPATARQVARELGLPSPSVRSLMNPDTNIALGTGYLRMMLDELQQDEVLATAAYNAGPHRVNRWLSDSGMPPDIWVELIPFRETRGYVQRVLAYAAIYDRRLGSKQARVSDRLGAARARG